MAAALAFRLLRCDVTLCPGLFADNSQAVLYLLSAVFQGLCAVLALLVTLSLVAGQLAATAYTRRIVHRQLRDWWLWLAIAIYFIVVQPRRVHALVRRRLQNNLVFQADLFPTKQQELPPLLLLLRS